MNKCLGSMCKTGNSMLLGLLYFSYQPVRMRVTLFQKGAFEKGLYFFTQQ